MTLNSLLRGIKIVTLAINTPGPVAAWRLAGMGASITKVEPPPGDPLKTAAPAWYASLSEGQTVVTLDLKSPEQRAKLDDLLADAALLIVSFRPSALRRLELDWDSLHARHTRLCCAGIIGYPPPLDEQSGHDLTYLADSGLLFPPDLPRSLFVDLAGAETCASLCLALLLNFTRSGEAQCGFVSLYECAQNLAQPFRAGLTAPGGVLSGHYPLYSMYRASDGWIAIAALEPHFARGLLTGLGLEQADRVALESVFRTRTAAAWEAWANQRGLPLAVVKAPGA